MKVKKGDIWSQAVSSGLVRDMKFGYDEGFQRSNADHSVFIKRRQEETTVLLVYSVYNYKFISQIMILVRKAASKQVE